MAWEDEMMKCSFAALALDTKSKDTNMSKFDWDSCLVERALLDAAIPDHQAPLSPAKEKNYLRGKMRTAEVLKHKYSDSQDDFVFPTYNIESSHEDIFRVWDLPRSAGEGEIEFFKELNNTVLGSYTYLNDCRNDDSVNHLAVGVADLTLNPGFNRLDRLTTGIADMSLDHNHGQQFPKQY